jgi:plastocyanin
MRVPSIVAPALLAAFVAGAFVPAALASREAVVYLTASGFAPRSVTIHIGDRVRFTVRDHKPHQLAKTAGPDSGEVAPNVLEAQGASVTLAPNDDGVYVYVDRLNPRKPEFHLTVRAVKH